MGFIARHVETGNLIDIFDYDNPRLELKKGEVVCHLCDGELIIKDGLKRTKHFSHIVPCGSDYLRHPESYEHLFFKKYVAEEILKFDSDYLKAIRYFEYPIDEVKRVADIVFEFPNGWLVAHEIQLSSITVEELERRTNDYRNAAVDVFWWFGKSADTPANRQWAFENYGTCYTLDCDAVRQNKQS